MRTVSAEVKRKVWTIVQDCRGKARAVTQAGIARRAGVCPRVARDAVKALIEEDRCQICSDYKGGGGYYLPETEAEIEETREILRGHALSILKRAKALGVDIDKLQTELFEDPQ